MCTSVRYGKSFTKVKEKGRQRKGAFFQNPTASLYVSAGKGGSGGWGGRVRGCLGPATSPTLAKFPHTAHPFPPVAGIRPADLGLGLFGEDFGRLPGSRWMQ